MKLIMVLHNQEKINLAPGKIYEKVELFNFKKAGFEEIYNKPYSDVNSNSQVDDWKKLVKD